MRGSNLKRNLTLIASGYFLQGFVTWYAIEKLFFRADVGLSYQQNVYVGVAATTSILTLAITLGILAERWRRKGKLILGRIFISYVGGLFTFV